MTYKQLYLTFLGTLAMFLIGRIVVVSVLQIETTNMILQALGAVLIAHVIIAATMASFAWQRMISRNWYFEFQMALGWFVVGLFSIGGIIGYAILITNPGSDWIVTPAIALLVFAQIGMVKYYRNQSDATWYREHKQQHLEDDDSYRMKL